MDIARLLVGHLTGQETEEIVELGRSALQELGNIMVTSYLKALSKMTNLLIMPSVPGLAVDMGGAVWESILAGADMTSELTVIRPKFSAAGEEIDGHSIFISDEDYCRKIPRQFGLEDLG